MFHCHASVAYLCKNGRLACGRTLIFDMYGDDDMMADLLFAVSIVVVLRLVSPVEKERGANRIKTRGGWGGGGWRSEGFFGGGFLFCPPSTSKGFQTQRQRAAEWKVAGIPMQGFFCLS